MQGFYDWYVQEALKYNAGPASDFALQYKSSALSPELFRRLREDSEAQARVEGEIVGLDFDPFLNSQDPEERYVGGNVTTRAGNYLVEVLGVRSGKRSERADVVPELTLQGGRWLFKNFHYGESQHNQRENLLSILQGLRENRQKQRK